MTPQSRAFSISLGVHAVVCCCIFVAGSVIPRARPMLLDFSINHPLTAAENMPARTVSAKRSMPAAHERKTITPLVNDEQAVPLAQEKTQESVSGPVSDKSVQAEQASGTMSDGLSATAGPAEAEAAKTAYLSMHFRHIRDTIINKLTYPMIARTMGWSGKVTVAFTVCADGSVEELSIVESSGFTALDNNALETIRKSCPLPKPPVKTALIMPVVYRLE